MYTTVLTLRAAIGQTTHTPRGLQYAPPSAIAYLVLWSKLWNDCAERKFNVNVLAILLSAASSFRTSKMSSSSFWSRHELQAFPCGTYFSTQVNGTQARFPTKMHKTPPCFAWIVLPWTLHRKPQEFVSSLITRVSQWRTFSPATSWQWGGVWTTFRYGWLRELFPVRRGAWHSFHREQKLKTEWKFLIFLSIEVIRANVLK